MDEKIITPVEEDIEVGLGSHTLDIKLKLTMQKEAPDASFNYKVDIDEFGQIVIVPEDTTCSFTEASGTTIDVEEVINDNEKTFSLDLTADMMFEDDNQDDPSWEAHIDEVGQVVISPIADRTSFLTVSVKDSLNLITEEKEEESSETKSEEEEVSTEEVKPDAEEVKEEKIDKIVDNTTAEVIEESVEEPHMFGVVHSSLKMFTEDFSKNSGIIKTGFITEAIYAKKILEKYYSEVTSSINEDWTTINYSNKISHALTEDIDPNSPEFVSKKEAAEELIDEIEDSLNSIVDNLDALERLFREIGIHYQDIEGYFTNYIRNFIESDREISCYDFRTRLEEYENKSSEEDEE